MIGLEELMRAMLNAPAERRADAMRVLRGQAEAVAGGATPPGVEPLLGLNDLAKLVGFSPSTLWRWRIPGHDLGGRKRFRLSEVLAYFDGEEFKRRRAALRGERNSPTHAPDLTSAATGPADVTKAIRSVHRNPSSKE
jgi:predicted DNA-binding transcriptional regulator AlpA